MRLRSLQGGGSQIYRASSACTLRSIMGAFCGLESPSFVLNKKEELQVGMRVGAVPRDSLGSHFYPALTCRAITCRPFGARIFSALFFGFAQNPSPPSTRKGLTAALKALRHPKTSHPKTRHLKPEFLMLGFSENRNGRGRLAGIVLGLGSCTSGRAFARLDSRGRLSPREHLWSPSGQAPELATPELAT